MFHLSRIEPEWTATALERDFTLAVDDVQPVGHAAVGAADAIIDIVDQDRHAHFQQIVTLRRHGNPFEGRLGLGCDDADPVIRLHAPTVSGMSFTNIHGQELDPIAILLAQVVEGPKLGPERPSGEAPKDENHWLLATVIGQGNPPRLVMRLQGEPRRRLTDGWAFEERADLTGEQTLEERQA